MSKNKKEEDESIMFKIITLGNSGVGKTSIIKRYVFNQFDQSAISSIGVIFSFKDVLIEGDKNKKVKLKLIDTAGEEKYRSLSKTYYKNAEAVLFVYSEKRLRRNALTHRKKRENRLFGAKNTGRKICRNRRICVSL